MAGKPASASLRRKAVKKTKTKPKPKQKPKTKKLIVRVVRAKVPVSIAVARADEAASKPGRRGPRKSSRDVALVKKINEAHRTTQPEDWWAMKREALHSFSKDIDAANFRDLVERWKDCQMRLSSAQAHELPPDRCEVYSDTLASIEGEWKRRSALLYSKDAYFDWPTTAASPGAGQLGNYHWVAEGMLSYLGYRVSQAAELGERQRQALLRRIFKMRLPPLESPAYLREWGSPSSPDRLKKMADSIASFARLAKYRSFSQQHDAIGAWERDLSMLREEFYVAKFGFAWPSA